jgi:5-methyltetrahydropteroyltriglutamate--homocysteine methyltransferase
MQRSSDRILTTHVGSLPRDPDLAALLIRQERGEAVDDREFERLAEQAVHRVVQKQVESGVSVLNDGEQPRVGFQTYVPRRMRGFGGASQRPVFEDYQRYPDYAALWQRRGMVTGKVFDAPQAVSELSYADLSEAERECDLFQRASAPLRDRFVEAFMTAASPGIVATTMLNAYYDSHQAYVLAVAREMKKEYELIHRKGFVLQLDCPDLAMERVGLWQGQPLARFLEAVEVHVEAINQAVAGIPRDRIRLHVCWGNWDGPHDHDVALEDILPIVLRARVGALSLELANPRHQHEIRVLKRVPLPDDMLLLPGVVDSTCNFVEHPEVIADRICTAVDAVGDRERVIASVDCGFGTFAGWELVAADVVWAKLRALREGADVARARLWGSRP